MINQEGALGTLGQITGFIAKLLPFLVIIVGFAMKVVVPMGMFLKGIVEKFVNILPANQIIFFVIAGVIFVVGLIVNLKYTD